MDQIIEICAVKLQSAGQNICIVAIYKAPSGNFVHFLNRLERILNTICGSGVEFIICGDININYLQDTPKKKQLNSLLLSFNLFSIIDFLTRRQNNAVSLIDNIFTDYSQDGKYQVFPLNTGLSDHDTQLLIIRNVRLQIHKRKKVFNISWKNL
jgi:transposase